MVADAGNATIANATSTINTTAYFAFITCPPNNPVRFARIS